MSQQGKQFLSGLVNRVFHSKKKTNAPSRRLGMEPLEDRQLLAVDPTLLAAANAEAAQTSTVFGPVVEFDLSALSEVKAAAPSFSVSNGTFEETTLVSKPESFQATVGDLVSHATFEDGTSTSAAPDISVSIAPEYSDNVDDYLDNILYYVAEQSQMGWAATLANMLAYTGWGPSSEAVDPELSVKPENQVFDYFVDAFSNEQSSLVAGLAWFMNGAAEYMPQGQEGWAQIEKTDSGNLFAFSNWGLYTDYCREILASDMVSPLYSVQAGMLANNDAVGIEVRFANANGETIIAENQQQRKAWYALWGFATDDRDGLYSEEDKEYYTGVVVSDPNDGSIKTIPIEWNDALGAYCLVGVAEDGVRPYIYSFTQLSRMPGYGVEADEYEKNNSIEDFYSQEGEKPKADLGEIDKITEDDAMGGREPLVIDRLALYSDSPNGELIADPIDYYAFELGQTASNSDYILLEYQDAYGVAPLSVTLYLRGDDDSLIPLASENYGYEPGRYDATFSKETSYQVDAEGKTYSTTVCRHRISLAGLNPAGYDQNRFYLKVEFADPNAVGQINNNYKLTFHAGYDDSYEQNDEFEDVANAPVDTPQNPSPNLGVLFQPKTLSDLVLKQYNRNENSEVDWYRFEMTAEGNADSAVNLYYKSKFVQTNDGDLDIYLYKADDTDPRGYKLVTRSEKLDENNVESISLNGMDAGVYFVKIVGFKGASNVGYKLEINPGVCHVPDAYFGVPSGHNWDSSLVLSTKKEGASESEVLESETTIGADHDIYLNYSVAISENAAYSGVRLALYINNQLVSVEDLKAALESNADEANVPVEQLKRLFGVDGSNGLDMEPGDAVDCVDFNIGHISDKNSLAGKYFNGASLAENSIAIVVNPANYELGAFYETSKIDGAFVVDENEAFVFNEADKIKIGGKDGKDATFANDSFFVDGEKRAVKDGQEVLVVNGVERRYVNGKFFDARGEVEINKGQKLLVNGLNATYEGGTLVGADGEEVSVVDGDTVVIVGSDSLEKDEYVYYDGKFYELCEVAEGEAIIVGAKATTYKGGKLVGADGKEVSVVDGDTVVVGAVKATYQNGKLVAADGKEVQVVGGETVFVDDVATVYRRNVFLDAEGKLIETNVGSTATVERNGGEIELTKIFATILPNNSVAVDYVARAGVAKNIEYLVDNNIASARFTIDQLDDDMFVPNANPSETLANDNPSDAYPKGKNPNLGVVNIENLVQMTDQNGDPVTVGEGDDVEYLFQYNPEDLKDLRITGHTDATGAAISDWFKFELKDERGAAKQNYADAFVSIRLGNMNEKLEKPGDLDLYLYKAEVWDKDKTFEQAAQTGEYSLTLVAKSSGISDKEEIYFADVNEKANGKENKEKYSITEGTYFIRVAGFGDSVNSYDLQIAGFTLSGVVPPTDPQDYFNDKSQDGDCVTILNSVATLSWEIPPTDYLSGIRVRYRALDADGNPASAWIYPDETQNLKRDVTGCKIAGLEAGTNYEFQLQVKNYFTENDDYADEFKDKFKRDEDGWLCASVVKSTADFLNEVVYHAVIVGVNDYPGTAADLTAAVNDAEAFRDSLLEDPQWANGNITFLKNSSATKTGVMNALDELAEKADDNDVVVFYFAGGGASGFVGRESVGYLKTYGSNRAQYISSLELTEKFNEIAAGSKLFFLDAGQVAKGVEETAINYDAFKNSLTNSKENGASKRPAQVSVLTAGANSQITPIGEGQRSVFNKELLNGIEEYRRTEPEAEDVGVAKPEAGKPETEQPIDAAKYDGRVTMQELADFLGKSESLAKLEALPTYATNDVGEAVLANGRWTENEVFNEKWLAEKAIVVTTTVDTVDAHDGKISLREAAALVGTAIPTSSELVDGAKFSLAAGSVVTLGSTTGTLAETVVVEYVNGAFRTTEPCALDTETKLVEFKKPNVAVSWSSENWDAGSVSLTDDAGVAVADVEFKLYATAGSQIVDDERFEVDYLLTEESTLTTAREGGETLTVVKNGQGYALQNAKGEIVTRATGLYLETSAGVFEEVKLSTRATVEQEVEMTKIVFDESLAGQALTVDETQGAIVLAKGGVIDATALKGELCFDASTGALRISGTDLVSLIGVKICGANEENKEIGSAIIVDEGARFELANSLIYDCNTGANPVAANAGWLSFVNVTVADCLSENALVANAGELEIENTLFALNFSDKAYENTSDEEKEAKFVVDATGSFEFSDTNVFIHKNEMVVFEEGEQKNVEIFVDAENDDYRLARFDAAPIDKGANAKTKLACGFVLDVDLAGSARIGVGGGSVDAGAYEFAPDASDVETPSTVVTTFEDIVNPTDGEISLREAFGYAGTTYEVETELQEGDALTTADGRQLEIKNGVLVEFEGVSGTQSGMFYSLQGVFMIDAFGNTTELQEEQVLLLADGREATVRNGKLVFATGIPVPEGEKIVAADGSTGALSYGAVADFIVGQGIRVALTAATVQNLLPAGTAFDAGTYDAIYQKDGTFAATVAVTTVDETTNKETTTQTAITFTLPAGAEFLFLRAEETQVETEDPETGEVTTTTVTTYTLDPEAPAGLIAVSRTVDLEDGVYTLAEPLLETIGGVETTILEAGTALTLARGVFTQADGKVVELPRGAVLISPNGAQVVYQSANFAAAELKAGDVLTLEDGSERIYKEGLTVYESITLGTTITFKDGLTAGLVKLQKERGEITVERAVTLDATTIGGLTIDADGASRVFNVDMYRETSATASANFVGLTIQNGAAEEGGLIYVAENSSLKISDSTLKSATATRGGAVFNAGSFFIDANSKKTLVSEVKAEQGGAIYNEGTLSVGLATIDGATADAEGGAIYNVGTASLVGATIEGATAGTDGGAVYNAGVFTATRGATISGANAQNGAAIYNVGNLSANNATFADSVATGQGGAIYNAGKASLTNAKLTGNEGGAVYNVDQFFATRSIFADNVGGAVISTGSATLASSLVLANKGENALVANGADASLFLVNVTAVGNEGGVYASEGALTIYNSIIGGTVAQNDATFDAKYSMIETTVETLDSTNATVYEPNFAEFDQEADWTKWNLRLGAGSAALDKASSEYAYYFDFNGAKVTLKVDFNGEARETGDAVDMGAYEINANTEVPSTVVTTLDDTFDPYDGKISLREAVKYAALATGSDEASRTVTFSPDLFTLTKSGTIELANGYVDYRDPFGGTARQDLGAIVLSGSVVITSAYVDEFGETKYYDITIDGRGETQLFVKIGEGDVEFRGFTFTNGNASGENKNGGAFELREGSLSLVDSVVSNSYASKDGGAVYQSGGVFFAVNTAFYGNEAKRYGGAVAADAGKVYIYNSTVALNDAGIYGGVYSEDGLITLANSIVAQNGGAQNVDVRAQNLEATTNLIGGMDAWRTVAGLNGNVVGTIFAPADPRFVSTDPTSEDFLRLSADSPAINSGSNVYAFGPDGVRLKFDLNGDERIAGTVVDMGAFESQYLDVPSTVVTTLVDDVNQEDGLISLREAIAHAENGSKITFDLGMGATDASIRLKTGALTLDKSIVLDASNIPGGLTIEGDGDRIFNIENGAEVTLENIVMTGGEANDGGAIYMESGKLTTINCVIYGNEATKTGGAIYAIGGDVKLLNTTIAGNEAQNFPGVYFGNANGLFELQNSIIAANAGENSVAIENYDLHVTGTFAATASIVGAATEALQAFNGVNGVLVGSPEAFVDAGFVDEASNNYALNADSPAVNKGSNRLIGQAGYYASILLSGSNVRVIATDLNGETRLVGGTVDMGAYEYQIATEVPSIVVTTELDVVDPFDGLISLREAIDYAGSAYNDRGYVQKVGTEITFDASLAGKKIALAETLEITKCVTIDAIGLKGGLTLDAGGQFVVVKIDAIPDTQASEVVLAGLTITGGFAECGAGVYSVGGDVELLNCVVYGNEAQTGAGVRVDGGSMTIVNTTITKNEATNAYGGFYSRGGQVALRNSIIALNTVNGETDGADAFLSGSFTIRASLIGVAASWISNGYDGVAGNLVGSPNAPVDPSFIDWANNDFALGQNADGFASVALNAGDNSLTVYPNNVVPAYDAAGAPRFVGSAVDMGAYESPLGPTEIPSLIVTTAEDVVDPYDGDISLREAVAYANNYGLDRTITFAPSINGSTFYLNSELKIGSDLTIDGLANDARGIVLTTSNDVSDQRIINVDTGNVVLNGLTITNRRSERLQAGLDDLSIKQGGAIYVRTGSVSIYNSLLMDNAAENGSAVYVNEANSTAYAKLVNCTVVANTTNGADAGAALYAELGSLQLYNAIVALNETTASGVAQDVYQGAAGRDVQAYNSFVSRSETLADMISGNGCFIGSSELDLTAETNALFVDADNQNYRLTDNSLATNGGDNKHFQEVSSTFNGTFDSFDLDGQRRIYYTTTDMGAFENQAAKDAPFGSVRGKSVTLNVSTGADVVDPTDGKTSLREALALSDRVQALGYDSVAIRFLDDYTVKVGETAFQVNSPVTILGANATIDCGAANSAFLVETKGAVVIENFEIKNGSALDGGAIKLSSGELILANVLMHNCEATVYGGALYVAKDAKATLYNVTAAKNVAVDGAGVYGANGSEVKIYNSIIASNRSATSGVSPTDVYFAGDEFELAYSLVGNAGTAANASKLNGKATNSQIGYGVDREIDPGFIDASGGNFRLSLATSPANGEGSRDYVYGENSYDLNGEGYGANYGDWVWIPGEQEGEGGEEGEEGGEEGEEGGEGENGEFVWVPAPVSMGAYQVSQEAPSTVVTTLEDVVDSRDGLISLREALLYYGRDNVYASGTGSLDGGAYAASNAMNTAYSATFYSPVTFDPSLAGGTIVLDPALGTIQLNYRADTNQVYDYMIDASSIAGLGGITIDGSRLGQRVDDGEDGDDGEGGGDWFRGSTMFQLQGSANTTNGWYWPVHLDLRNVNLVGSGLGTAIEANRFAMVSMRSCLVEGYSTAISVQDDDSADGGIAHIYSSTLLGNVTVGGKAYIYNSIVTGQLHVQDKETDPGYRTATVYNSYVYSSGGLTGRISKTNVIEGGSVGDLFVDWANGDYRLARYSPAVNRGDNQFLRTLEATHAADEVDLNGNLRVDNGVVDMGCYESQKMVDVPSTTVTTELDVDDPTDGLISIREALAYAVQNVASATLGKTVKFDATLDGKTIVLDGVIELNREVNFDGGTVDITLDAAGKSSIFSIALNADDPVYGNVNDFTISNLTLTGGYTTKNGGAIEISRGNVLLNGVDIYGCSAGGYGGAIYAYDGELTLTDCRIGGNSALYYGGVVNQFGTTVLTGCYVAENSGTTKNSDVWGQYQHNYSHSKNNVIGFVKDITIVDGQYGNRVGTEANPLKPFVNVSVGNLEIKPENAWGGATTPTTPQVSASMLDDAFAAFVDEEDAEFAVDLAVLEETVFDDDLFASFEQF